MALKVYSDPRLHICFRLSLLLLFSLTIAVAVDGQTATYHLHGENSAGIYQLKTAGPDVSSLALKSVNLKGVNNGEYIIAEFATLSGVPNASGVIPAGSTVSFSLWLRKTAQQGTMFPRVRVNLNTAGGTSVCVVTGSTELTTTLTKYTLTGTVPTNVSMTAADCFYLRVGINLTAKSTQANQAELNIEGTLNGNYDSLITVPLPIATPSISSLSPNAGTVGTSVNVTGTAFGATQGTSTITFNGVAATPTSWSNTSISVSVPGGASTGPVVVSVNGRSSNGVTFTVTPKIDNLSPNSGVAGTAVTISGTTFGSSQGTSTVTFNGTAASPNSWNATSIVAPVPAGAASGPVVVTVNGQASNGATFTVIPKIDSVTPSSGRVATAVTIVGTSFGAAQGTSTVTFNGATAATTSWSNTSISVLVPGGASTGPVVVTVNGQASNGPNFTVTPKIDSVTPSSGTVGTAVTIVGATFGAAQGTSTVTFNGVAATPTSWSNTSISVPVPAGVSTGPVVVTVNGQASNGATFTVIPKIDSVTPGSGRVATAVTIVGTSFGAAQGTSTVTFNGATAATTSWSNTSIAVLVPAEASTGPVVVTVNGQASNGPTFTVAPKIDSVTPSSGAVGTVVTIVGATFGATQGTSTVTFNGVAATPTSWNNTSISVAVPAGASTGPVVVTVNGEASNSATFTFTEIGSITGTITRTSDNAPIDGALIEALQAGIVQGSASSPADGSYSLSHLAVGTYDVRVSAIGYQTRLQRDVVITPNTSTLVDEALDLIPPGGITYIYDELGRLVGVVTPSETATYSYDIVGNLLSISRRNSAQLSIIAFTPGRGGIDTEVTIYGTAFSTTPSENTVTFNGVPATITSATVTQIITNVPVGATTGPIRVTTPLGIATSSTSFVVGDVGVPTITGFNPAVGAAGTSVSVTGTNFEPVATDNQIKFNVTRSDIASSTTTTIDTSVPSGAASGRLTVQTPAGSGSSEADFFVVPAPYTAADVAVTGRMAIGSDKVVNFAESNKIAILVFDGSAGQKISLGMKSVTLGAPNCCAVGTVTIFKPDGTTLINQFGFGTAGDGTPTNTLPVTGTYTIFVDPLGTSVGSVTLLLSEDLTVPIAINGPPVTLNMNRAGQNARLTFDATAGQRVSVGLSAVTIGAPNCCSVGWVSIVKPDGSTQLAPQPFNLQGEGTATQVLPVSGTYAIQIDPIQAMTGNVTVTLSEDLAQPISINGPPVTLTNRAGQNARLTFDANAGQRVSVGLSAVTIGAPNCCAVGWVSIVKPDGSTQMAPLAFGLQGEGTATQVLPVAGTYAILIDPIQAMTGNVTVTLSEDLAPPISINGPAVTLTNRAGQNARLTFDATAGQRVSVGLSAVSIGAPNCCAVGWVSIIKPDGSSQMAPVAFGLQGEGTATQVLPVAGTYAILIDPIQAMTGNVTVTLSEDLAQPISINGPPVTLTNRAGQNARLTFDANAGQRVSVGLSAVSIGAPNCCAVGWVSIIKPDGSTQLAPLAFGLQGEGTATQVLPESGTYAILIDPIQAMTGNVTVTLSEDLAPPISINGPAVILSNRAGQNARLTFDATVGQRVSVGLSAVTIGAPNCCAVGWVSIIKPDGSTQLAPLAFGLQGEGTATQVLPVAGTYAILIDPIQAMTGNVTVTLSEDLAPPISINGPAVTLTNRAGQNARLTFDANAGQRVSVGLSAVTIGAPNCCAVGWVSIVKPDGSSQMAPLAFGLQGEGTATQVLPVAGTYAILIDPIQAMTGDVTVTLSEELTSSISIGGPPVTLNMNRVGQDARLTFDGTAGQAIVTVITGNSISNVTVRLLNPDGTQLSSITSSSNTFSLAAQTLQTNGTYTLTIDPPGVSTGSLTLSIQDLSDNLALNKPATQSSTDFGGIASRAVDGNTDGNFFNGSVTHTLTQNQAWWEVDVGTVQAIRKIDVWNRTDCCSAVLTNFYVFVSDQPFTSTDLTTTLNQPGVWSYHDNGQGGTPTSIVVNRTGRYIRVQLAGTERLMLAEVQVWK